MSTKNPRSASFKFKVALAALSGKQTMAEICQTYQVAESVVYKWKKQLLDKGEEAFSKPALRSSSKKQEARKSLYSII